MMLKGVLDAQLLSAVLTKKDAVTVTYAEHDSGPLGSDWLYTGVCNWLALLHSVHSSACHAAEVAITNSVGHVSKDK